LDGEIPFENPLPQTPESLYSLDHARDGKPERISAKVAKQSARGLSKSALRRYERQKNTPADESEPVVEEIRNADEGNGSGFNMHYSNASTPVSTQKSKEGTSKQGTSSKPKLSESAKRERGEVDWKPPPREHWQIDKEALKAKFPEGWKPLKKLSPDALSGIRALHAQDPIQYTTRMLANSFQVSPEAMRRILRSKWSPNAEQETDRQRRWLNRGKNVWMKKAELGEKPPKRWRQMGIGNGKPEWMVRKQRERELGKASLPALITANKAKEEKLRKLRELEAKKEPISRLVTTRTVPSAYLD
jgi:hypothetical protein